MRVGGPDHLLTNKIVVSSGGPQGGDHGDGPRRGAQEVFSTAC